MTSLIDILSEPKGTKIALPGTLQISWDDHDSVEVLQLLASKNLTVEQAIKVINSTLFWLIYALSTQANDIEEDIS